MAQLRKKKTQFDSLFDPQMHFALLARGERRFSLKAIQGALMITLYSGEQRFHIPHSLLIALMDIDSLITKWRCKQHSIQYFKKDNILNQRMLYLPTFFFFFDIRQSCDTCAANVRLTADGIRGIIWISISTINLE